MANTDNIAKPTRLPWIQGNQIELALPLQIVYFTENGKYIQDYIPQHGDVIKVLLESKCHCYEYTPTVEDGNVLHITDDGQLCVGTYSVTVAITNTTSGKKHRSKWNYVIDVYDDNAKVVEEFDDFPDWGEGAIIDNSVFYFVGTKDVEYITVDTIEQLPQEGVIGNIYRVANYDGTQVNPNAYAEYYWNGTQYKLLDVKNYGIDEKPTNGSTNLVESGGTKSLLDEKANKNGYYETLGAGTATNLRAIDAHDNTFKYRKTGGTQSIVSGTASIESIKGNTLSWNSLLQNGNFNGNITNWRAYQNSRLQVVYGSNSIIATMLESGSNYNYGIYQAVIKGIVGHRYYSCFSIKASVNGDFAFEYSNKSASKVSVVANTWTKIRGLVTPSSAAIPFIIKPQSTLNTDDTYEVTNVNLFDLTLIYGSDAASNVTVEQFEADYFRWFGKPLTYEPYDAGSIRNVQMQGLKTIGFNQWDEEWELGYFDTTTGNPISANNRIRTKNIVRLIPNTTYYTKNHLRPLFFDSDGNFISTLIGYTNYSVGSTFITPQNAIGAKFNIHPDYGTTYNNDICINISDTNKNGTYEPYEEYNVSVPVTTLTGKVNGQGSSVVIFPDGMKGVNDVKDEIRVENGVTKAIKRIGRKDLGTMTWTAYSNADSGHPYGWTGYGYITGRKVSGNILSPKYNNEYNFRQDKTLVLSTANASMYVVDSSLTGKTAQQVSEALSGVYLDYELAEPIEYVVDDFALPVNYIVNNGGTEEIIDAQNTIGIAPTVLLRYSIDAAKTITNLPVDFQSQESMANLLNALGAAMGGTWTTTFDTTTNRYTYSFTPNT